MIYEEETELLRKGFFEVQNEVGLGHREEVYHKAMAHWLDHRRIPFASKVPLALLFEEIPAHTLYPDLTVWNKITIELKAVPRHLREPEQVQMFNYLKRQNHKLGLLVNMGLDRVHVKRIVHEEPIYGWSEDWGTWRDRIDGDTRTLGIRVRDLLLSLYETHRTGYGSEVVEAMLHAAMRQRNICYARSPVLAATYQGCVLGDSPLDCWVLANKVIFVFTALFDDNQFNTSRGLSYMRHLNIPWGIAANFGKHNVQVSGLSIPIRGTALPSVVNTIDSWQSSDACATKPSNESADGSIRLAIRPNQEQR